MDTFNELVTEIQLLARDHEKRLQTDSVKALDLMVKICLFVDANRERIGDMESTNREAHAEINRSFNYCEEKITSNVVHLAELANLISPTVTREPKSKPCPFCGSDNIVWSAVNTARGNKYSCHDCGASSGYYQTVTDLKKAWNRRSND